MSEKKFDLLVVGSCVQDLVSYTPRFPEPGESVRGTKFCPGFGGKGANQAVQASKLGANTAMVGRIGNDMFGPPFLDAFRKAGVNTDFVKLSDTSTTATATITVAESGQNAIVVVLGANMEMKREDVAAAEDYIKSCKVLACQLEIPVDVSAEAMKVAKKYGVITIFNPAPGLPNLSLDIMKYVDILCPNENEAELLSGRKIKTDADLDDMLTLFLSWDVSVAVITLGDKGCIFATQQNKTPKRMGAESVKAIDTTGAGDSFVGALAFYTAKFPDLSIEERLKRAQRIASNSVTKPGTQSSYPQRAELPNEWFL